jgi:acetyltransferase-like isoleucine patch superfamily enzyme
MKSLIIKVVSAVLRPFVLHIITHEPRIWGSRKRLHLDTTVQTVNTLFNTASGQIHVGSHTFFGHDVLVITGSHDYNALLQDRQQHVPREGRDITIGRGVWVGSGAVILGPSTIGDHAVIASGAVVAPGSDIPEKTIVAGIPAKVIKHIS